MNLVKLLNDKASRKVIAFLRRKGDSETIDFLRQHHEFQFASVPDHIPYFTKEDMRIEEHRVWNIVRTIKNPVPITRSELESIAEENNLRIIRLEDHVGLVDVKKFIIPEQIRPISFDSNPELYFEMIGTPNAFMDLLEGREPREPIVLLTTQHFMDNLRYIIGYYGPVYELSEFQTFRLKMNTEKYIFPKMVAIVFAWSGLFAYANMYMGLWLVLMLAFSLYLVACYAYRLNEGPYRLPNRRIPNWSLFF